MSRPTVRLDRPYSHEITETQLLPFTIRLANGRDDIEKVCLQRAQAYGRHQPDLVTRLTLSKPETEDLRDDVLILMAESKETGEVVGALRLQTNLNQPLRFETELALPERFRGKHLLEAGRMTVRNGPEGRMVLPALVKAAFEISYRVGIDFSLLIGRAPIDRMYHAMQFQDMFDGEKVVTSAQPGVPVTLFYMDMPQADARWIAAACPLYGFMAQTLHPDIDIDFERAQHKFCVPLSKVDESEFSATLS
jgi:hypothetical protein